MPTISVALIPGNRYKLTQQTWGHGKGRGLEKFGIASFAIAVRTHGEDGGGSALAAIVAFQVSRKGRGNCVDIRKLAIVVLARAKNFLMNFVFVREIFIP